MTKWAQNFTCWLLGHRNGGDFEDSWIPQHGKLVSGWRYRCPRCGYVEPNPDAGLERRNLWKRHVGWRIVALGNKWKFRKQNLR